MDGFERATSSFPRQVAILTDQDCGIPDLARTVRRCPLPSTISDSYCTHWSIGRSLVGGELDTSFTARASLGYEILANGYIDIAYKARVAPDIPGARVARGIRDAVHLSMADWPLP